MSWRRWWAGVAVTTTLLVGCAEAGDAGDDVPRRCLAFVTEALAPSAGPQTGEHVQYDSDVVLLDANLNAGPRLTDDGQSFEPDFSPDGQRVVYTSTRGYPDAAEFELGLSAVWVIGVDGTGDTRLTQGFSDRFPRWSPDGTKVAFVRGREDGISMMILDAQTGALHDLGPVNAYEVDWFSNDALTGVATDETDYSQHLLRVDVTTGEQERVDLGVADVGSRILWSPDRREFAYVWRPDPRQEYDPADRPVIRIRDVGSGAERNVPGSDTLENQPLLWTTDDEVLFRQNTGGEGYNIASSADGGRGEAKILAASSESVGEPRSDNPTCSSP